MKHMKKQRAFVWTGGQPCPEGCQEMADALPLLPTPAPLRRAAHIEYQWGKMKFTALATACSVRTTAWGGEQVAWLHCKAMNIAEIKPDEPTGIMTVLIPVYYVTVIKPGPTFRLTGSRKSEDLGVLDLGVFPPNYPAPAQALPLSEVERVLEQLLEPERN
jgi:hypothetical protein